MKRTIVATDALWRLVDRAGRDPDPDLRAAAHALVKSGTNPAPPRRTHLSPQEAAGLLGVSVTTVYRRIHDGSIPHERLGRLVRIPAAVVTNPHQSSGVATGLARGDRLPDDGHNEQELSP